MSKDSIVKDLIVSMQGQEFYLPVYLLPISSAYLIPRATWLATLGPHVADYAYPKIKIYEAGKLVTLMSEKPKLPQQSHLHHLRRAHNTNSIYELFTIQWEEPEVPQDTWLTLPEDLEPNFAVLLDTYKSICDKHVGVPPPRLKNHSILLVEGVKPVKVRPYKYLHNQKEKIERWCMPCWMKVLFSPSIVLSLHLLF